MIDENSTIREAIEYVEKHRDDGTDCPVCGVMVKIYKRKLDKAMISALTLLYEAGGYGELAWVYSPKALDSLPNKGRDTGKLAAFMLIEENPDTRVEGKNGVWRVTTEGEQFLKGELAVYKYALICNNKVLTYEGDAVHVNDVVAQFSFDDLMAGV